MLQMQDTRILNELKQQFVVVEIDFYDNGEDVTTFIFRKGEHIQDESQAYRLYEEYDELYNNDDFDGAFEEFLHEKGINYATL
jgi:hypothetical protein